MSKELLDICLEFFELRDDGVYLKTWRKGYGKDRVGTRIGNSHHSGYKYIKIDGKLYGEHRIVWLMTHGEMPQFEIDHLDGVKSNNSINNLREAKRGQNCANREGWSSSGFKGVYPTSRGKPWQAQITVDGNVILLGRYDTKEQAAKAYDKAALFYKGEFAKTNFTGE